MGEAAEINKHCTFPRLVYCRRCRHRHKVVCKFFLLANVVEHSAWCAKRDAFVVPQQTARGAWSPI